MQALISIATLVVAQALITEKPENICNGVTVNGVYYDIEILKTDIDRPYLLIVDDENGDLYFSYSLEETRSKVAKLNLYTKEYMEIPGIKNGFCTAINKRESNIYIGGSDGIYQYDKNENRSRIIAAKGNHIWSMFYKNRLYFSIHPTQAMYYYDKYGKVDRFNDLRNTKVEHFVIDSNGTIFFTNESGLYTHKLCKKKSQLFQAFPEVGARALSVDKYGTPYICLQDGIYAINKKGRSLKKLLHIDDAFGLAFDSQNALIYSDFESLIRLKRSKNKHCE